MKIQKSKIVSLVLKQSSISAVFQIVRFAGDQKTALTGESLYLLDRAKVMGFLVINSRTSLYRGVFSPGAMGALAPAFFGHFSNVGKIAGAK